jgi:hypothetical protein
MSRRIFPSTSLSPPQRGEGPRSGGERPLLHPREPLIRPSATFFPRGGEKDVDGDKRREGRWIVHAPAPFFTTLTKSENLSRK